MLSQTTCSKRPDEDCVALRELVCEVLLVPERVGVGVWLEVAACDGVTVEVGVKVAVAEGVSVDVGERETVSLEEGVPEAVVDEVSAADGVCD